MTANAKKKAKEKAARAALHALELAIMSLGSKHPEDAQEYLEAARGSLGKALSK